MTFSGALAWPYLYPWPQRPAGLVETAFAELAKRWRFPNEFSEAIKSLPTPLEVIPFNKIAAVIHIAAWRARSEENKYSREEMESTFPDDVAAKLGVKPTILLDELPPLAELGAGMEELIS